MDDFLALADTIAELFTADGVLGPTKSELLHSRWNAFYTTAQQILGGQPAA